MTQIITTQNELDAALAKNSNATVELGPDADVVVREGAPIISVRAGSPRVEAWGSSQPRVEAWDSSQPRVVAWGSSQPHVEAWGSSQPHIVAGGSSQPHVVAWGSSRPHVEAWGSSQPHVVAWGSSRPHVEAWGSSRPHVVARDSSRPHVVARDSSQPHVVALDSSQPRVEAWESSQPHIEAGGSSQPHVVAWGSSQPHIEAGKSSQPSVKARGYTQISLRGAVSADCGPHVSVLIHDTKPTVTGGQRKWVIIESPADWCEYYGVEVNGGVATLYKALNDDWTTGRGISYAPGTTPEAPDWDGGDAECGGGLHFSPRPAMARHFNSDAARYVACPVALEDMAVHPDGRYPDKCKARRVCAPCYEVDMDGTPITEERA